VCNPAAASAANTSATRALGLPATSLGRAHIRIDPPWVGSGSTSTTVNPPEASARCPVKTV
jgi:hypothetical protein